MHAEVAVVVAWAAAAMVVVVVGSAVLMTRPIATLFRWWPLWCTKGVRMEAAGTQSALWEGAAAHLHYAPRWRKSRLVQPTATAQATSATTQLLLLHKRRAIRRTTLAVVRSGVC